MNPYESRDFQIKSLLNWKNFPVDDVSSSNEVQYVEVDDVVNTNFEKYCNDLQCILINPPWSSKAPKFEMNKFVKII